MKWILLLTIWGMGTTAQATSPLLAVVNKQNGNLQIIRTRTGQTIAKVPMGYLPHEVLASRTGGYFAVSNYGKDHVRSQAPTNQPGHTLTLVRAANPLAHLNVDLGPRPCAPHGMDASVDGRRLYVTCEALRELLVIDTSNGQILRRIPTGQADSHMVAISRDETRAYTSNFSAGTVTAIDLHSGRVLAQIQTGPGTEGLSLSPMHDFIYASSVLGNHIVKIDAKSLRVIAQVKTGRSPVRVIPTPNGETLVVSNSADGTLQTFRASDLTNLLTFHVGRQPIGLVVPTNNIAYSAAMRENRVLAVDLTTGVIHAQYTTGQKPDGIAVMEAP